MLKIPQKDGSFLKISRQKSRRTGRKRGRPRKVQEPLKEKTSRKRPYQIIVTSLGKQREFIKSFRDEQSAYEYFTRLLEENKKIRFPIKTLNSYTIKEAKFEIFIIKKIDENTPQDETYLRNDYGEFIKYETNSKEWIVIDKSNWNIEETFWINGYDPKHQRKTFEWIFKNCILNKHLDDYCFSNILVYQNKVLIDTDGDIDIVFCKCVKDSYRLYNELEKECQNHKLKRVLFNGDIGNFSRQTISSWVDRLCDITGFSRSKILRTSLRP